MHLCSPRLAVGKSPRTEDDQQSGEHYPGGTSSAVHGQLYDVTDLWLVQLPSQRQHVRAQHTRHSTHRQRHRHGRRQRLDLVESDLLHWRLSTQEFLLYCSKQWHSAELNAVTFGQTFLHTYCTIFIVYTMHSEHKLNDERCYKHLVACCIFGHALRAT